MASVMMGILKAVSMLVSYMFGLCPQEAPYWLDITMVNTCKKIKVQVNKYIVKLHSIQYTIVNFERALDKQSVDSCKKKNSVCLEDCKKLKPLKWFWINEEISLDNMLPYHLGFTDCLKINGNDWSNNTLLLLRNFNKGENAAKYCTHFQFRLPPNH